MKKSAISLIFAAITMSANTHGLETAPLEVQANKQTATVIENGELKSELMARLELFSQLSASFVQRVFDEDGELLQSASGNIQLKKPNLINWHTSEPDESLIVSDGDNLWFYDPFIEQASVYTLENAIANTPILLLTSQDKTLWQNYSVGKLGANNFSIKSLDENSQVKSLELTFGNDILASFTIKDVTGQISKIVLSGQQTETLIPSTSFNFVVPEGVHIDDQR